MSNSPIPSHTLSFLPFLPIPLLLPLGGGEGGFPSLQCQKSGLETLEIQSWEILSLVLSNVILPSRDPQSLSSLSVCVCVCVCVCKGEGVTFVLSLLTSIASTDLAWPLHWWSKVTRPVGGAWPVTPLPPSSKSNLHRWTTWSWEALRNSQLCSSAEDDIGWSEGGWVKVQKVKLAQIGKGSIIGKGFPQWVKGN